MIPTTATGQMMLDYGIDRRDHRETHDGCESAASFGVALEQDMLPAIEAKSPAHLWSAPGGQ